MSGDDWPMSCVYSARTLALVTLACAGVLGCGGDIDSLDVPDYEDGSLACADAPALGLGGQTAIESLPIVWSEGSDAWYGEPIVVQIPDDLTSLQVSAVAGPHWTGMAQVSNNGTLLIDGRDNFYGAPFFHYPAIAGSTMFPINEDSALDPGCLQVVPVSLTDPGGAGELYFASRRTTPGVSFDLEVVLVGDTVIAATELEAAVAGANEIYATAGSPMFDNVSYTTLAWDGSIFELPGEEPSTSFGELAELLASYTPADPGNFSLFVIQDFTEPGTFGVAAGIPGPNGIANTGASGLVVSVDTHLGADFQTLDLGTFAETIAHELGHQLGLFHTSEAAGDSHDPLADTAECDGASRDIDGDGELSAEECDGFGGGNVMFWTAGTSVSQTELSPTQIKLLSLSPIAD